MMTRRLRLGLAGFFIITQIAGCAGTPVVKEGPDRHEALSREVARMTFNQQAVNTEIDAVMLVAIDTNVKARLGRDLSPDERERIRTIVNRVTLEVYPQVFWENVTYSIYMQYFSVGDLEKLIQFYRTPVGQKLRQFQTTMTTEVGQIVKERMKPRQAEYTRRLREEMNKEFGQKHPTPQGKS